MQTQSSKIMQLGGFIFNPQGIAEVLSVKNPVLNPLIDFDKDFKNHQKRSKKSCKQRT